MAKKSPSQSAEEDKRAGKSTSTQAGEFVRDEIERIRGGEHGARSAKQAIAIGLSRARRAGVKLAAPKKGTQTKEVRHKAELDLKRGKKKTPPNRKRAAAAKRALQREPTSSASKTALSRQTKSAARKRSPAARSASAKKAARTRNRGN